MITVELPDGPFFRGQTLKGSVHFSSSPPRIAKQAIVMLHRYEAHPHRSRRSSYKPKPFTEIFYRAENVEITPSGRTIKFQYTIPEDAPFTFDSGPLKISWHILALLKFGRIPFGTVEQLRKSTSYILRHLRNSVFKEFAVLPHILKAGLSLPVEIPLPVCKRYSVLSAKYRSFHSWRYTWLLHKTSHVQMLLRKSHSSTLLRGSQYVDTRSRDLNFPGDEISGTLYFAKEFKDVDLNIYLVFLSKPQYFDTTEEEQLIAHTPGTFSRGSSFSFSFDIPTAGYPTFQTKSSRIWWVVRVVVSSPFRFTKVVEQEIPVQPLIF